MKKCILTIIAVVLTIFVASFCACAEENINIYVNGEYLETSSPVVEVAGRTMVPMRDICEAFGYSVHWNDVDQSIVVEVGNEFIQVGMRINTYRMSRIIKSNSPWQVSWELDVPPMLIYDKTYLPIRALSEALFFDVTWDAETSSVHINTPEYQIGATSGKRLSKIMMYGDIDAERGFTHAGLMDLYGNVIIPYGPAPTYEEVFARTNLKELIADLDYSRIDIGKDGGWSQFDYRVHLYDKNDKHILTAHYALDGTVHNVHLESTNDNGISDTYILRDDYDQATQSIKEGLYGYFSNEPYINNRTSSESNTSNDLFPEFPNGVYIISTKLDQNYVIDINGSGKANGDNVQLGKKKGTNSQKFNVTSLGNGYYQIVNVNSGKALDAENGGIESNTNIWQYELNGTSAQIWKIEPATSNSFYIINKESGLYLDVDNAYADNGTNIKLFERNDNYDAQKWHFLMQ